MVKAILFDFMGVLLFKKENYVPNSLVDNIDKLIGRVTDDEAFKKYTQEKYGLSDKQFEETLVQVVNKYEKYKPIWDLLPSLKKKYKLAIINNGTALTLPLLKREYKIDEFFDIFFSSAIEGVAKPDPLIYRLTTEKLGVKPSECLFMDDSQTNIEGAKSVGMQTIWWKDKEKGFTEFKEFLEKRS